MCLSSGTNNKMGHVYQLFSKYRVNINKPMCDHILFRYSQRMMEIINIINITVNRTIIMKLVQKCLATN